MKPIIIIICVLASIAAPKAWADIAYLALAEDGLWQVWVMQSDGTDSKQVTDSAFDKSRISWYPDGENLLVNGNDGRLYRVSSDGGKAVGITTRLTGMLDAMISPNGKQIVFSLSTSDSIDDNNIWVIDADGSNPRKITQMSAMQHEPVWDAEGEWIYFLSGDGGQAHDIWRVRPDGSNREQITVNQLYHFDLAPGPEGQLAFSSNRSGNYEIWLQKDQQAAVQLTDAPALDARPSWSPDGERIVYESSRGGLNIWMIQLDSRQQVQLTHHKSGARFPVWYSGSEEAVE